MIDFTSVQLEQIAIHQVGNKLRDEGLKISSENVNVEDSETRNYLLKYFLSPFDNNEVYNFTHPSELNLNEIYFFAKKIFAKPDSLFENSVEIAKHLYEKSTHPKINAGELCICYFKKCSLDGTTTDALGFFKSEGKDVFLKFDSVKSNFKIKHESGINVNKLDKGCLIFNIEKANGFKVCVIDSNKSNDTQYWKNDFLNIKPCNDSFHATKDYLNMCKNFVTKQMPTDFEVTKTDQIDLLNRSMQYFKEQDEFDMEDFSKSVIQFPQVIESFKNYKKQYENDNELELNDSFEISDAAVKKQNRVFKSVLKLDKNFHIYIHGKRELIEQGVEKDGRKYYKIYFQQES